MTSRLRKFALTAHITFSVSWLGSVGSFLALAVAALVSTDGQIAHAAYVAMEVIAWFVILPLALASLLTGLIQSLGTTWGLLRYYWVMVKFAITIFATTVLILKLNLISYLARAAASAPLASTDLRQFRIELLVHAAGGLLVLLVPTVLSVYKPWGLTAYGRRKQNQKLQPQVSTSLDLNQATGWTATSVPTPRRPGWSYVVGIHAVGLIVLFIIFHLTGGRLPGH